MMNEKITYTTILHQAREELKLTTNEYCIADIIYHLSNNPKNKVQGWCYASKQTIGKFIGVTKSSVLSIIERLEKKGIVEKDEETKYLKTTEKWFNTVVITRMKCLGKETIPLVKKPTSSVKKPTAIGIETIPNIYKDKNKKNLLSANADETLNSTVNEIMDSMNSSSGQKNKSTNIFSSKDVIEKMINDKQKHIQVVGIYWKWLGWGFENKEQYQSALKRDLRAASALKGYSLARIKRTFKKLDGDSNNGEKFAWNLNTVHKTIDNIK